MNEDRRFAFIPRHTTHSKKLNSLPVSARWLYVVMIAERGGLQRPFDFSYKEIRKVTGFAKTTIRYCIKKLEQEGFLTYEHGGLENNPNLYELEQSRLEL